MPLPPPPPRATPFFQPHPELQQPKVPRSMQQRDEPQAQQTGGLGGIAQSISQPWSGWFRSLFNTLKSGKTQDVTVAGTTFHFVDGVFIGTTP